MDEINEPLWKFMFLLIDSYSFHPSIEDMYNIKNFFETLSKLDVFKDNLEYYKKNPVHEHLNNKDDFEEWLFEMYLYSVNSLGEEPKYKTQKEFRWRYGDKTDIKPTYTKIIGLCLICLSIFVIVSVYRNRIIEEQVTFY